MKSIYDILLAPVMTEKSMGVSRNGSYTFLVDRDATKCCVKESVEKIFNVKVAKVNVLNRSGKRKTFKGRKGKHLDRKYAIVSLSEGSINYEGGF